MTKYAGTGKKQTKLKSGTKKTGLEERLTANQVNLKQEQGGKINTGYHMISGPSGCTELKSRHDSVVTQEHFRNCSL